MSSARAKCQRTRFPQEVLRQDGDRGVSRKSQTPGRSALYNLSLRDIFPLRRSSLSLNAPPPPPPLTHTSTRWRSVRCVCGSRVPPFQEGRRAGASRRYRSAVQPRRAYFKGVDGFHGSSKRSVKLASEGELARRGLRHLLARWLKMSGFILGMLHLRVGRQILSAPIPSRRVSLRGGGAVAVVYVCAFAARGVGMDGSS